jgi:hypothetical protein
LLFIPNFLKKCQYCKKKKKKKKKKKNAAGRTFVTLAVTVDGHLGPDFAKWVGKAAKAALVAPSQKCNELSAHVAGLSALQLFTAEKAAGFNPPSASLSTNLAVKRINAEAAARAAARQAPIIAAETAALRDEGMRMLLSASPARDDRSHSPARADAAQPPSEGAAEQPQEAIVVAAFLGPPPPPGFAAVPRTSANDLEPHAPPQQPLRPLAAAFIPFAPQPKHQQQ